MWFYQDVEVEDTESFEMAVIYCILNNTKHLMIFIYLLYNIYLKANLNINTYYVLNLLNLKLNKYQFLCHLYIILYYITYLSINLIKIAITLSSVATLPLKTSCVDV